METGLYPGVLQAPPPTILWWLAQARRLHTSPVELVELRWRVQTGQAPPASPREFTRMRHELEKQRRHIICFETDDVCTIICKPLVDSTRGPPGARRLYKMSA